MWGAILGAFFVGLLSGIFVVGMTSSAKCADCAAAKHYVESRYPETKEGE